MSKNSFYGNFQDKFRKPSQKYFHSQQCSRPVRVKRHTGTGYLHFRLNNVSNDCYKAEEVPRTPSQARLVAGAIKAFNSCCRPSMQFSPYFLTSYLFQVSINAWFSDSFLLDARQALFEVLWIFFPLLNREAML